MVTKGLTSTSNNFSKLSSDMTVYASFKDPSNLILILGLGGERILSKNFEFFQAATIGSEKNLYGFRRNRYAGKSSAYGRLEMRLQLADIKSSILPGRLGLTSFYNIGRVWLPGESSRLWHSAYGGGLYFMPYNLLFISFTAGFTPHEKLFNFSVGSKIYLNY
jgi:hemolysin activation/secretion protein